MKFSKKELRERSKYYYSILISTYGLTRASAIVRGIVKLLKEERKRRKD